MANIDTSDSIIENFTIHNSNPYIFSGLSIPLTTFSHQSYESNSRVSARTTRTSRRVHRRRRTGTNTYINVDNNNTTDNNNDIDDEIDTIHEDIGEEREGDERMNYYGNSMTPFFDTMSSPRNINDVLASIFNNSITGNNESADRSYYITFAYYNRDDNEGGGDDNTPNNYFPRDANPAIYNQMTNLFETIMDRSMDDAYRLEKNDDICMRVDSTDYVNTSKLFDTCTVCCDTFKDDSVVSSLDCTHIFHTFCISEWCKYKQECPLCKSVIPHILLSDMSTAVDED